MNALDEIFAFRHQSSSVAPDAALALSSAASREIPVTIATVGWVRGT